MTSPFGLGASSCRPGTARISSGEPWSARSLRRLSRIRPAGVPTSLDCSSERRSSGSDSPGSCCSSQRRARRGGRRARAGRARRARARSRRARPGGARACGWRRGRGRRGGLAARRRARRCRRWGGRGDHERPARRGAERAEGRPQVLLGAAGRRAEVGLGDHQHVGHLHDPGLQELQRVAAAGLHDHRDGVGGLGDVGLGLPDADGLDHDDVEGVRERLRRRAGRGREPAEPLAGGHAADEDVAVGRVVLDPRAVAEQRAAGALGATGRRRAPRRCGRDRATRAATPRAASTCPPPAAR